MHARILYTVVGCTLYICNKTRLKTAGEEQGAVCVAPPEEAPCCLQHLPHSIQLPLHILELKQVAEDELVLSHSLLTDHNAQWPLNLQAPARHCRVSHASTAQSACLLAIAR